jgi:hypothetical protein
MTPQQPTLPATSNQPEGRDQSPTAGFGPGRATVNPLGIILISAYVVLLTLFSGYVLIKVWPHCPGVTIPPLNQTTETANSNRPRTPTNQNSNSSSAQTNQNGNRTAGNDHETQDRNEPQCQNPTWIEFFWGSGYWIWEEVRLLLIVIMAGMLGALLHDIRSLFWYVGHRDLRFSWLLMYLLLPLTGALMAVAFYFLIRGGFFPQAKADQSNPIGFAALAFLMGLFTAQAGVKLKQVFETIFSPAPQGINAKPQVPGAPPPSVPPAAPKVTAVSPAKGATGGGQSVVITGENFSDGAAVRFGEAASPPVTFVSSTTVNAVTPPHAAGAVNVVITNKDGRSGTLPNGFTFEG